MPADPELLNAFSGSAREFLAREHNTDGTHGGINPALYDAHLMSLGAALKRSLTSGLESFGVGVLSESTANNFPSAGISGDWPYEFGVRVAAGYPGYTVDMILFDDTAQDYLSSSRIATGASGERGVTFAAGNNSLLQPVSVVAQPTGDFDITVKASLANWGSPGTNQPLFAHFGSAGNKAFRFMVLTSGLLFLDTYADGTTQIAHQSSVATGFANGATKWVRVTFRANNGSAGHDVKFYTGSDGFNWTQLGTTVTTAGVSSLFNSTANWELGGYSNTNIITGTVYEARIRSGIPTGAVPTLASPGPIILPCFPDAWEFPVPGQGGFGTSGTVVGSPVFKIVNGSVTGKGLTYLSDATRLKMLLPDYAIRAVLCSTGHNDDDWTTGAGRGKTYLANWATWMTAVKANAYQGVPVIVTQNPRRSPATYVNDHAIRREMLLALASQLALPSFDAYQTFVNLGDYSTYTQSDGLHPTTALNVTGRTGAQTWADDIYRALNL